jgi:hypothetical protein
MSLYETLRISKNATREEVESAFKKYAMLYHPDRNREHTSDFVEVNNAYSILKDKHKKQFYDIFGEASIQLLLNNRESYILTRIFDRINIYTYSLILLVNLCLFLSLPVLVACRESLGLSYTTIAYPVAAANVLGFVPFLRSFFSLHKVYGFIQELRGSLYVAMETAVLGLILFTYALHLDRHVKKTVVVLAIFFILETLSLVPVLWHHMESIMRLRVADTFVGSVLRACIFILLISPIFPGLKPFICLLSPLWIIFRGSRAVPLVVAGAVIGTLYATTFSLVLCGFTSLLIYIPLLLFYILVGSMLFLSLSNLIRNMPRGYHSNACVLELPYYAV